MSYGIGPTHRQEQRNKQGVRLFLEERVVEIGHVIVAGLNATAHLYDVADAGSRKFVKFCIANKRYTVVGLFAVALVLAMVL